MPRSIAPGESPRASTRGHVFPPSPERSTPRVAERAQGEAAVGGLPHAAPGGAEIEDERLLRVSHHRVHSAAAERADFPPCEAGEEAGIEPGGRKGRGGGLLGRRADREEAEGGETQVAATAHASPPGEWAAEGQ